MPTSIRLKPDIEKLLDKACKRQGRTRSALIHDALAAFLDPQQARLGDIIGAALRNSPQGFGIERDQSAQSDTRHWGD